MAEEVAAEGTTEVGSSEELGQGSEGQIPDGAGDQAADSSVEEPKYVVKVDGREVEVTLEELTAGYSRQQDYTKKTQSLAQERQRLAQLDDLAAALERNPIQTIAALAPALGINPRELAQALGLNLGAPAEEELEPWERVERKVEQFMSVQEQTRQTEAQRAAQQQHMALVESKIRADLSDLHDTFGTFDDGELMQYAVDHKIEDLGVAMRAFQFDRDQDTRIRERNQITESKRKAQVVEGGTSAAPGAVTRVKGPKMNVREAAAAAMQELGLTP